MTQPMNPSKASAAASAAASPGGSAAPLTFGDEHALLRQTARRFVTESCAISEVRRFVGSGQNFHEPLARAMADQGWLGMLIPEAHQGAGMDHRTLAVVLEETGRQLVPAPLIMPVLAAQVIARAGSESQKQRWLPAMAAGDIRATVALCEPGGSFEPDAVSTRVSARAGNSGYILSGVKNHVLFGAGAQVMLAPALLDDGALGLFLIEMGLPGVRVEPEIGVDPTRPMARVSLDRVELPEDARLVQGFLAEWRALYTSGYALLAAESIGAAQAVLMATRDYANERVQFDRPIGAFQAVKHPLVNVLIALENARSLCAGAMAAIDAVGVGDTGAAGAAEIPARMAKVAADQALNLAVDRGVQLHGGYGFTWDCDMHFYFKRALHNAATLGDPVHHRRHLAAHLLDG
jgi:alkylation response protein AidB-like acyl-CoA dehydrogenase